MRQNFSPEALLENAKKFDTLADDLSRRAGLYRQLAERCRQDALSDDSTSRAPTQENKP